MTLIFKKYFLGKTSLLNHHIMKKEKKGEKENITLFFITQEITLYPSQHHLIKLLYFSSSLKPHI